MSISGITTSSTATSLISGTTYSSNTSASSLLAQGQGLDEAKVSKGGQQMSQLSKLQTSDPEKFKAAAQEISDKLAEAAKNSSDEGESSALSDMSSQWAEAAETGDMSSLQPKAPPSGAQNSSQSAAMKFKGQQQSGSGGPMGVMESVVSSVLSGMNISTSSSSSSGSSASSYYSTASSSETAA